MTVIVGLKKLERGKIQVNISRLHDHPKCARNYPSEQQARHVLRQLGLSREATDYYVFTLFPHLAERQQLNFPAMHIPERRLLLLGFNLGRETDVPLARSA